MVSQSSISQFSCLMMSLNNPLQNIHYDKKKIHTCSSFNCTHKHEVGCNCEVENDSNKQEFERCGVDLVPLSQYTVKPPFTAITAAGSFVVGLCQLCRSIMCHSVYSLVPSDQSSFFHMHVQVKVVLSADSQLPIFWHVCHALVFQNIKSVKCQNFSNSATLEGL